MTPMMQQYKGMKARYPDAVLLFRMGDFYEMFFDDARAASRVLNLVLTSRNKGPDAVPMAGFPFHAAASYINKLIRAGHKVAICEQMEDPAEAKGLVDRDIIRVITPGTLTDEMLLEDKRNNYLCSIYSGAKVGLAWVDISTGHFQTEEIDLLQLANELGRISPAECIVPDDLPEDSAVLTALSGAFSGMITRCPAYTFDRELASEELMRFFRTSSLDGFGVSDMAESIAAAGALVHYIKETQKTDLAHIRKVTPFSARGTVAIDRVTRSSLELIETMRTREEEGSLLGVLDRSSTPMGARLLRTWITFPLTDVEKIQKRQDGVGELFATQALRMDLAKILKDVADIERITSRIACKRSSARDLLALKRSIAILPELKRVLGGAESEFLKEYQRRIDELADVRELIEKSVDEDAPLSLKEGGLIKPGFNAELDEIRLIGKSGRSYIAKLEKQEIEKTGISSLKVGYNKVFGYYIEITNIHHEKVPSHYVRKQTLKNAERYITSELKEYEAKVLSAQERSVKLEYEVFREIRDRIANETSRLQEAAEIIAGIDVLLCLAEVAIENDYVKPEVAADKVIDIKDGRHPVLEKMRGGEAFVPNDAYLDEADNRLLMVTGPNMAGKSTYIRQVALLVLMAQTGSFIPARRAKIGVVDKMFTRVGASDEIARGQSTFMVEMVETANILNNATGRSLIILDEVGRGTSTFDGVSIAWAVSEYIQKHIKARTLFATHYHELAQLSSVVEGVKNYNIAVREWNDEIIFLRKIIPGGCDKSYGIHVARIAGVPGEVIERSKSILAAMEEESLAVVDKSGIKRAKGKPDMGTVTQLSLFGERHSALVEEIKKLKLETMSPLEAMNFLYKVKREVDKEQKDKK